MRNIVRFDSTDKKGLLRSFVLSSKVVKPEEVITPFSNRSSIIVTKTNSRRVPESEVIATASAVASLAGSSVKVALNVADKKAAEMRFFAKGGCFSESERALVNAFIEELEENGFSVSA